MVKILVCQACRKLLDAGDKIELSSTWRNLIYGCPHEIEKLDREVMERTHSEREGGLTMAIPAHIPLDKLVSIVDRPQPIVRERKNV